MIILEGFGEGGTSSNATRIAQSKVLVIKDRSLSFGVDRYVSQR